MTVRQSVAVDEAADTFTGNLTIEVRLPDATVVFTVACVGTGTRLGVEAPVPGATPAVASPVPYSVS